MTPKENRQRMQEGRIYAPFDDDIMNSQAKYLEKLYDYNMSRPLESEKRQNLLKEMFAEIGTNCYIEPPLHTNMGGHNVHFGNDIYANFNLTLVDDADIYVGNKVMFAPNVVVATATHPILSELREIGLQFNRPVHIGNNVWIGAGAIILPGVSIGNNSVIGAGSVVTHDIPSDVVAYGSPCRVAHPIGEHDREYYYKSDRVDIDVETVKDYIKHYVSSDIYLDE